MKKLSLWTHYDNVYPIIIRNWWCVLFMISWLLSQPQMTALMAVSLYIIMSMDFAQLLSKFEYPLVVTFDWVRVIWSKYFKANSLFLSQV